MMTNSAWMYYFAYSLILVLIPLPSLAVTIHVPGDQPTIQAGIDVANDGDTVLLDDGVYTGEGNRDIQYHGKAITVCSQSGNPAACIIDCEGSATDMHTGFWLYSNEGPASILEGLTVSNAWNCWDGGGIFIYDQASPTIINCIFTGNFSEDYGGGVFIGENSSPTFSGCVFSENSAGFGGGMYCENSSVILTDCVFIGNSALYEGGGMVIDRSTPPSTLTRCTFVNNSGGWKGGAVHCCISDVLITACTLSGNSADVGGGLVSELYSSLELQNSIIAFSGEGEAINCEQDGTVVLSCCDIYGNAGGDWTGCIQNQYGVNGNIGEDPLFCLDQNPDEPFTLRSNSPCAAENNPGCGQTGAWPIGCVFTATKGTTWSALKTLF